MQQILHFIKKFKYGLLFLFLEIVALSFTVEHHTFHRSKYINSANWLTGGLYSQVSNLQDFIGLKSENTRLIEENTRLKNLLSNQAIPYKPESFELRDSSHYFQRYKYRFAKVINNNYTGPNNYLTIDKGAVHGIRTDMGVINSRGIIGIVKNVSANYATILSILHDHSKINVRLKKSDHFGTVTWDGEDYSTLQLTDLPRQAPVQKGDTVISGGKSLIFPEGIALGTVENIRFENNRFQKIDIVLFNDMSALGY
ncbi:MAG: rod shape-determining protein MreC, partial [Lutibacter sp.]|nr:rod shape-determining protein MreC [Lutibacter sp.]